MTTRSGQVQGIRLWSGLISRYFAFKGIPYAEPPVGNLRFRNPLPTRGWSGVLNGTEHRSTCTQGPLLGIIGDGGSEDCLFLNVYTPQIVGNRAVMVNNMKLIFSNIDMLKVRLCRFTSMEDRSVEDQAIRGFMDQVLEF